MATVHEDPKTTIDSHVFDDRELVIQLAKLKDAGPDARRAMIALLPLEQRICLATEGVISRGPDTDAVRQSGRSTAFAITDRGKAIIEQCARVARERPEYQ